MQYSLQVCGVDAHDDERHREHPKYCKLAPELRPFVLLKCVIEIVIPIIEANIEPYHDEGKHDDGREQPDSRRFLFRLPIRPGKIPGLPEKAPLRHLRHPHTTSI